MLVTWGVEREGNFGRQGGEVAATSPVSGCFSWVAPAVVMAVTCPRWEGDLLLCRPFMKGKIIQAGQQLNRMKEWLGGTGEMVVVREEPQHRATWSMPHLWWRQAGWLGWPETVTSLVRKLRELSLTQISQQEFLPGLFALPLHSKLLDAVE